MRSILVVVLCTVLTACGGNHQPRSEQAKSPEADPKTQWQQTISAAEQAFKAGNYDRAEQLAKEAASIIDKNSLDLISTGVTYTDLSVFALRQQKTADAEKYAKKSLETYEEAKDEDGIALACLNLANVKHSMKDYGEAEKLQRRALAIREKTGGKDNPQVAIGLSNLANVLMKQAKYDEANDIFLRALVLAKKNNEPQDVATIKACLGSLRRRENKFNEAEKFYKEAIAEHEKVLDERHPLVADDLYAYAKCLDKMGRATEATKLRERANVIYTSHKIALPAEDESSSD